MLNKIEVKNMSFATLVINRNVITQDNTPIRLDDKKGLKGLLALQMSCTFNRDSFIMAYNIYGDALTITSSNWEDTYKNSEGLLNYLLCNDYKYYWSPAIFPYQCMSHDVSYFNGFLLYDRIRNCYIDLYGMSPYWNGRSLEQYWNGFLYAYSGDERMRSLYQDLRNGFTSRCATRLNCGEPTGYISENCTVYTSESLSWKFLDKDCLSVLEYVDAINEANRVHSTLYLKYDYTWNDLRKGKFITRLVKKIGGNIL